MPRPKKRSTTTEYRYVAFVPSQGGWLTHCGGNGGEYRPRVSIVRNVGEAMPYHSAHKIREELKPNGELRGGYEGVVIQKVRISRTVTVITK